MEAAMRHATFVPGPCNPRTPVVPINKLHKPKVGPCWCCGDASEVAKLTLCPLAVFPISSQLCLSNKYCYLRSEKKFYEKGGSPGPKDRRATPKAKAKAVVPPSKKRKTS